MGAEAIKRKKKFQLVHSWPIAFPEGSGSCRGIRLAWDTQEVVQKLDMWLTLICLRGAPGGFRTSLALSPEAHCILFWLHPWWLSEVSSCARQVSAGVPSAEIPGPWMSLSLCAVCEALAPFPGGTNAVLLPRQRVGWVHHDGGLCFACSEPTGRWVCLTPLALEKSKDFRGLSVLFALGLHHVRLSFPIYSEETFFAFLNPLNFPSL